MMTEDEAKTKWCHAIHARVLGEVRYPGGEVPPSVRCLGSACMAWRWGPPSGLGTSESPLRDRTQGYCGLAGRPA